MGVLWAIGSWNDWYPRIAERTHPRLGLRPPSRGVGEDLWDKLWLNRLRQPQKKDLNVSDGEAVWIPAAEVSSIDIHR